MIRKVLLWFGRLVLVITMVIAGGHTLYYLYYWEWTRAQIAGILFVAALVIAATWLILERLRRLERAVSGRLDPISDGTPGRTAADARSAARTPNGAASQPDFPWLAAEFSPPRRRAIVPLALAGFVALTAVQPRAAVFIPVLVGAGLIVSLVAALAERTATAAYAGTTPAGAIRRLVLSGTAVVAVAALIVAGLWWTAHYRPVTLRDGETELTVRVSSRTASRPAVETIEIIGSYCARNAIADVHVQRVEAISSDSAVLVVSPLLDEQAQRRYGGCLEDAILERHRLTVTETVRIPQQANND